MSDVLRYSSVGSWSQNGSPYDDPPAWSDEAVQGVESCTMTTEDPAGPNARCERETPWRIWHKCSSVHLLENDSGLRDPGLEPFPGITKEVRRDVDSESRYAIRLCEAYEELSLTTGDIEHCRA